MKILQEIQKTTKDVEKDTLEIEKLTKKMLKKYLFLFTVDRWHDYEFEYKNTQDNFWVEITSCDNGSVYLKTGYYKNGYKTTDEIPDAEKVRKAFLKEAQRNLDKAEINRNHANRILNTIKKLER